MKVGTWVAEGIICREASGVRLNMKVKGHIPRSLLFKIDVFEST